MGSDFNHKASCQTECTSTYVACSSGCQKERHQHWKRGLDAANDAAQKATEKAAKVAAVNVDGVANAASKLKGQASDTADKASNAAHDSLADAEERTKKTQGCIEEGSECLKKCADDTNVACATDCAAKQSKCTGLD